LWESNAIHCIVRLLAVPTAFPHRQRTPLPTKEARFHSITEDLYFHAEVGFSPVVFSFSRDTDTPLGESFSGWELPSLEITSEYAELLFEDAEIYPGIWLRDAVGWSCVLLIEYSGYRDYHEEESFRIRLRP